MASRWRFYISATGAALLSLGAVVAVLRGDDVLPVVFLTSAVAIWLPIFVTDEDGSVKLGGPGALVVLAIFVLAFDVSIERRMLIFFHAAILMASLHPWIAAGKELLPEEDVSAAQDGVDKGN